MCAWAVAWSRDWPGQGTGRSHVLVGQRDQIFPNHPLPGQWFVGQFVLKGLSKTLIVPKFS